MTSGGMSNPGGQGREKLLSRYLPLIASSTSLSINAQLSDQQAKQHVKTTPHMLHLKSFFFSRWFLSFTVVLITLMYVPSVGAKKENEKQNIIKGGVGTGLTFVCP